MYPDSVVPDSLALGEAYQEFVAKELWEQRGVGIHFYRTRREQYEIGESEEGYEVKLDARCRDTRRLSIEVAEKSSLHRREFTPSGIMRRDNTVYYVQGHWEKFWVFLKMELVGWYEEHRPPIAKLHPPTIAKFYLPISVADEVAEYTVAPGRRGVQLSIF